MPKIKAKPKDSLTVRIAVDTLEILDEVVEDSHIPRSAHIQMALNEYLAKHYPDSMKRLEVEPAD